MIRVHRSQSVGVAMAAIGSHLSCVAEPFDAVMTTELSAFGGGYSSTAFVTPGTIVECRVVVRFNVGAALSSVTYPVQGDFIGVTDTPTITSLQRVAPFGFGTQVLDVFSSASGFRIDDSRDAANTAVLGILTQQRPALPNSPPNPINPAVVLRFQIIAPNEAGLIHLHVPFDQIRDGVVDVYDSLGFPAPHHGLTNIGVNGAWLYVGGNPCLGQTLRTPPSQRVLVGEMVTLEATGESGVLQWYRDHAELFDSPNVRGSESATLTLRRAGLADAGDYVLFGMCSHTDAVRLDVFCPADFTNDGFVDGFDYDAFVSCFEGGPCPTTTPVRTADFNRDGFADVFDYDDFVARFEEGC